MASGQSRISKSKIGCRILIDRDGCSGAKYNLVIDTYEKKLSYLPWMKCACSGKHLAILEIIFQEQTRCKFLLQIWQHPAKCRRHWLSLENLIKMGI